ncbi:hypothetical protein [Paenibacillus campinasensis]|nr:hypothetical protein [Paenibacillus campinasensis]
MKTLIDRIDFAEKKAATPTRNKYRQRRLSAYMTAIIRMVKVERK